MESTQLPHFISSFREAAGLCLLMDETRPDHAIAVFLDRSNAVQAVISSKSGSEALFGRLCRHHRARTTGKLLVLSHKSVELSPVSLTDLYSYELLRWVGEQIGRAVIDWVETDGDEIRSFAYRTHPLTAWANDPTSHRRADFRAATDSRPT